METMESVNLEIEKSESELQEVRKKIRDTEGRLRDVKGKAASLQADLASLREKRQGGLAAGQDVSSLNASMKKQQDELDLRQDEAIGLEGLLKELKSVEANLSARPEALRQRVLQLQSVELAKKFNQVSAELAGIVKELNSIHFKLDNSGYSGRANRTVFLPDGQEFIENIIRLTFDDAALVLDDYIRKNVSCLPYTPSDDQKYFYKWQTHKQRLIEQKTE